MGKKKRTIEDIKEQAEKEDINLILLSTTYVNSQKKLLWKYKTCEHTKEAKIQEIFKGKYGTCRECTKLTLDDMKERLIKNNINIEIVSNKFLGVDKEHTFRCLDYDCQKEFSKVMKKATTKGFKCPHHTEWIKPKVDRWLLDNNKPFTLISEDSRVLSDRCVWHCNTCGHEWGCTLYTVIRVETGCPNCNRISKNIKNAEKHKKKWLNEYGSVYIIRCFNSQETFFKIGFTSNTLKKRYKGNTLMPYDYEVIKQIHTNKYRATLLEDLLQKKHRKLKYTPIIKFGGYTECFSEILPNIEELITNA